MTSSLRVCLLENVQRVQNQEFFWAPSSDRAVKPGFMIPGFQIKHVEAERFLENIRKKEFPDRPSRIGAIFLSATALMDWAKNSADVYRVKASGTTFQTSFEDLTEFIRAYQTQQFRGGLRHGEVDNALEWARQYWKGTGDNDWAIDSNANEIILQGKAVVVSRVDKPGPDDPIWDEKTDDLTNVR